MCEVVVVPYVVRVVVAVTVMHVLLFVLHVRVMAVLVWGPERLWSRCLLNICPSSRVIR